MVASRMLPGAGGDFKFHPRKEILILHLERLALIFVSTITARSANQGGRLSSLQTLLAYTILLGSSKPATIASPIDLYLPNLTSLVSHDPDPRFDLQSTYTDKRLPATAVLMSTVYLLAEAADLDMNSDMVFHNPSIHDDYPSVSISLYNLKPSVPLPCSFLVWALYYAVMDMFKHNTFAVSRFGLLWDWKVVGYLLYQKVEPSASLESSANSSHSFPVSAPSNYSTKVPSARRYFSKKRTSETTSASVISSPKAATTLTAHPTLTLRMEYLPDAKILSLRAVFAMIVELLKDNAEFPATALVRSSSTAKRVFDATLDIREGPSTRTPPYLKYTYLNQAISQLPRLMLSEGKFAEVTFQIELDNKEYV